MLKQETMNYIIEKMRGDSLTPLGTGKSLDEDDFHSNLDVYLNDTIKFRKDFLKLYKSGKPFLRGRWGEPKNINMANHYCLSYKIDIPNTDSTRYYMIEITRSHDYGNSDDYTLSVQFFVVESGSSDILIEIMLGEVISNSMDDFGVKEKAEAISKQVFRVFGIVIEG